MRNYLIITANCIANLAAGAMGMFAYGQTDSGLQMGWAAGAAVLAVIAFAFTAFMIRKSQSPSRVQVSHLGNAKATPAAPTPEPTKNTRANNEAEKELREIKDFLETIDRRKGGFDREGKPLKATKRLQFIFKGYGSQFDSNMQQVLSCGNEIRRSVEEIVAGSATQSDLVNKTTSFIEEMSARLISVCDNAESALQASSNVSDSAEKGREQIQELVDELKKLRNHAGSRERKLQTLGQHTKEIETIVQSIGTLSSRTDLLALNASIESVRAGEHGRGFAIVAEEVRALAEQSAQAVMDINRRLEMMQLETSQSMSVASGEHEQMNQVLQNVNETLDSLQSICELANDSKHGLGDISKETSRQLQLTQEIVDALEQSTDTTQKNRSRAEGAHWTAKTLGNVSGQLNESLELFRSGALVVAEKTKQETPVLS